MTAPTLLVDYGGVISREQPAADLETMARLTGLDEQLFAARYWEYRPAHDRGVEARAYWSAVIGAELTDDLVLEQLVHVDVGSWSHFNAETLEVLRAAHERGHQLAVLSNAPHEMAAVLRSHPAFAMFDELIFSSEIGVVKPNPGAFRVALERLHRRPAEVLFIDDRPDNVGAALRLGMRGLLFTSAAQLAEELAP